VAILFATLASWVYHSSYFTPFEPVRIGVVDAEQTASRRIVAIALPDVSSLRGQHAVLALQLRNGGPEPKRIGLLREGFQGNRIVLPPDDEIRWDMLVSPELMQVLGAAGAAARSLELTGDADVWSVTSGEIRNYRLYWGGPLSAAVLPTSTGGNRVWLSTSAFFLLAAALFAPVGLYAASAVVRLPAILRRVPATVMRGWTRHEVTFERGAALLGLVAIAIAQPVFEVVSNSPEFFPARNTSSATIVATLLAICVVLPLGLLAAERTTRIVSTRAASIFTGATVGTLAAAVVMPWLRRGEVIRFPWDVAISAAIGIAVGIAYTRARGVRQFLTALAPAALVVPALFLLSPNVQGHLQPSESAVAVQTVQRTPPIVIVIFDELPTNSLLAGDGSLDAERYPNFGAFARGAYWYRNANTVAYNTSDAVPVILSGRYVTSDKAVPSLRHYPVNLFTSLARHYRIFASMRFQRLCPSGACEQNAAIPDDTVRLLASDLSLVWLHIVLPENLTEELPPVVGEWAEFGQAREAPRPGIKRGREGWFAEFLAPIDRQPARMHVIHLVLPHMPFEYVPSGRRYSAPDFQNTRLDGSLLFDKASAALADTIHQRHLAQVGYADRLVGELIARLRMTGAYDDALVILTSDHGASYRAGRRRREPRQAQQNLSDILQVPLFIKLPGRTNSRPRRLGDLTADRAASLERKERRFGRGDLQGLYAPPGARHLLGRELGRADLKVGTTYADKQGALKPAADVQVAVDNLPQYESVARERDPLPIYVSGVLETRRADPLNVVVAVNGTVAAIARSYRARGGHMFGTLIPETLLRDGSNAVAAFVVDGLPVTDP
jgi:hypothetical protein